MADSRKITINPITRLEGHGKVTIHLNEQGKVDEARFHITQFRGFEVFTKGRGFEEMPAITARICGICPVSHQLASVKACDDILGVEIPATAKKLRELEHMGQYIQSHALHFFYLASPDLLLGWDADPAVRNIVGVVGRYPELARKGVGLRRFGQSIIAALGGKRIHPAFSVPGGVTNSLNAGDRDRLLAGFSEAHDTCRTGIDLIRQWTLEHLDEADRFANFQSLYMGLVDVYGDLTLYDGKLRLVDKNLEPIVEFESRDYLDHIAEKVEPWSYMKFPFYKPMGDAEGVYRVGPLARINAARGFATPRAQEALKDFRADLGPDRNGGSLIYHYARMIELLYALERAEELLLDPAITDTEIRVEPVPKNSEGIGVIEAPRGVLIHHYQVDSYGVIEKANLIVATGHNNLAMNRAVKLVADEYIKNGEVREGILNRVEGAIRCYDPCLSCATHALGQMPLVLSVMDANGELIREITRNQPVMGCSSQALAWEPGGNPGTES